MLKLKDEPLFLIAALCLFFPIGLIFLIQSERSFKFKWSAGVGSCLCFLSLLSFALLNRPQDADPRRFQVSATRETLSIGQSGGFLVTDGSRYYTDYTVRAENELLHVEHNLYTALKPGICTLTISFGQEERTLKIIIKEGPATDSIVLSSPSSERYHLITAEHAGKKAVEMTEEDALQSGKTPCKNCFKE